MGAPKRSRSGSILVVLSAVMASIGCQGQEDGGYAGDPLVSVAGSVTSARREATPEAEVIVLWISATGEAWGVDRARVAGGFPARFQLDVVAPPTEAALGGADVAVGTLLVMPRGLDFSVGAGFDDEVLGVCTTHAVLYAEHDVTPGSAAANVLGYAPAAGFHVMAIVPGSGVGEGTNNEELAPIPAGATIAPTINLVDDPASIDYPDFF